jgi:hypothetical protein
LKEDLTSKDKYQKMILALGAQEVEDRYELLDIEVDPFF